MSGKICKGRKQRPYTFLIIDKLLKICYNYYRKMRKGEMKNDEFDN